MFDGQTGIKNRTDSAESSIALARLREGLNGSSSVENLTEIQGTYFQSLGLQFAFNRFLSSKVSFEGKFLPFYTKTK